MLFCIFMQQMPEAFLQGLCTSAQWYFQDVYFQAYPGRSMSTQVLPVHRKHNISVKTTDCKAEAESGKEYFNQASAQDSMLLLRFFLWLLSLVWGFLSWSLCNSSGSMKIETETDLLPSSNTTLIKLHGKYKHECSPPYLPLLSIKTIGTCRPRLPGWTSSLVEIQVLFI